MVLGFSSQRLIVTNVFVFFFWAGGLWGGGAVWNLAQTGRVTLRLWYVQEEGLAPPPPLLDWRAFYVLLIF